MGWPTPQEYNEAIQNPLTAFEDPELRSGRPLLTPLGLPRPITGAFASVYQLACAGGRRVAVRCFLRDFGDHQERYAAISAHLAAARLPYMTNFTYLANGIRVNGRWYPVLKMDWLEGESLQTYVERNLQRPDVLRSLAEQWVQMAKLLRSASIGHGDLQHGNVIVTGGQLRLIDYDGMYVPALTGRASHEIGHRNYQHPQRSERDFGPGIDHFSTWVVYTSLVALSVQPQLWRDYTGGDECLIFRREDFEHPAASPLLRSLENAADPRLADLADIFHSVVLLPPDRVPPIDGPLAWPVSGNAPTAKLAGAGLPSAPASGGWVADYLGKPQPAPGAVPARSAQVVLTVPPGAQPKPGANGAAPANGGAAASGAAPAVTGNASNQASASASAEQGNPSWISDFIGNPQPSPAAGFGSDPERQRMGMVTPVVVGWLAWGLFQLFGLAYGVPAAVSVAFVVALVKLADGYYHDSHVQAERGERQALRTVGRQTHQVNGRLQAIEHKRERAERKLQRRRARLEAILQQSQAREQEALAHHDQRLQARLAEAQRRRDLLVQVGVDTVRRLQEKHAARVAQIDGEIAGLHQAEEAELQQTLDRRRKQFVDDYMKRQTIEAAVIAGIGPTVKQTLRKHGIVRAADLEIHRLAQVEGIGEARARTLVEWRRKAEALAVQTAPQSLSKVEETLIRGRFYGRRFGLEQEKGKAQRKLAEDVTKAQADTAEQLKLADQKPQQLRHESAGGRDAIRSRFQQGRQQAQADLTALNQEIAAQQAVFDQAAAAVQAELAVLNAQRAGITYRLRRYEGLRFGAYVRHVLVG